MSEYLQIGVDDDKVNDYLVVSKSFHKNFLGEELKNFIISINKYMNGEGGGKAANIKYKPVGGISSSYSDFSYTYSQALIGEKPIEGGQKKPSRRKTRKNRRKY
jgi:hypothetical protein